MFPYIHGFDHRIEPDLHRILEERRPLRRAAPLRLPLRDPGTPFTTYDPPPVVSQPAATLYELARDPRFLRGAVHTPRPGLRMRLGRVLLWLALALIRPGRA